MFKDTAQWKEINFSKYTEEQIKGLRKLKSGSNKKVHWSCNKSTCGGHQYETDIRGRTRLKTGCSICSNRQICKCKDKCNSLGYLYPNIIKEWHPTKNINISPFDFSPGSGVKINWICDKNHEWATEIYHRIMHKNGCPLCKLSKGETLVVEILNELEIRYEQQKTFEACRDEQVLPFDFYLPDKNICIEYDGI